MAKKITPLITLSMMEKIHRERKSPSMPPQYVSMSKFSENSANAITKSIVTFINLAGGQAERISSTGRMLDKTKIVSDVLGRRRTIGSTQWIKGSGENGTADISCTAPGGMSVKIEVKFRKDTQSDDQKRYEERVTSIGGIYIVAKDFNGFYSWWVDKYGKSSLLIESAHRLDLEGYV